LHTFGLSLSVQLLHACADAVLTWAVYCLSVYDDIQLTARQEVQQVCADNKDVSPSAVDEMM